MTDTATLDLRRPLVLLGCGKMGGAMLEGWLACGLSPSQVVVVDPGEGETAAHFKALGVRVLTGAEQVDGSLAPAVLVVAVKPQVLDDALLSQIGRIAAADTLVLSIAAGKRIGLFEGALGQERPIVRAMPNTPAAIGRGMTVLVASRFTGTADRALAEQLCAAVGSVGWVEEESLIDAVTALSGGGPAYVFLLIEALARAGEAQGLAPELAMRLARETVSGAGELARRSAESAAQLRRNVTSPKGTTERALAVLMAEDGLQPLFDRAIAAATARSRELAG